MKKIIGILYICTGPYSLFWKDFYESFEEKFLKDFEKRYFVFTDAESIPYESEKNVFKYNLSPAPWPLITLLRFSTFLTVETELKKCDYIMFSNANMVCDAEVSAEEFLPREKKDEKLFVTEHPGYFGKSIIDFPYDRNKKSLAYIPWNCGKEYVIGAMFGGEADAFIELSKTLKTNIEEDLKKGVIALWHDESHLNRYIIGRKDVRYLAPSYCYPYGMQVDYERKISAVGKESKFDIKTFKGQYASKSNKIKDTLRSIKNSVKPKERILFLKDSILCKKLGEK